MRSTLLWLIIIFRFLEITSLAQEKDPYKILNSVKDEFERVKDYSVDVNIKVNVDFLNAPISKAKIFFKQPDKVKVKSDGFVMLPKHGIDFSPSKLLDGNITAIYSQTDTLNSNPLDVIKVIPDNDSSEIILSKLWVDSSRKVIRKIESTSKTSGTFTVELSYNDKNIKILPSEVLFKFELRGIELPSSIAGITDPDTQPQKRGKGPSEGNVLIKYSNYKINQNLSDSFFDTED